jgi:hypothetical protein
MTTQREIIYAIGSFHHQKPRICKYIDCEDFTFGTFFAATEISGSFKPGISCLVSPLSIEDIRSYFGFTIEY